MECQQNATDKIYVIERHQEYVHWFLEEANLHHTVFIDECTAYGQREVTGGAYSQVCGQKERNTTICLSISPVIGVIHHVIQMGGVTRELFAEFLNNQH